MTLEAKRRQTKSPRAVRCRMGLCAMLAAACVLAMVLNSAAVAAYAAAIDDGGAFSTAQNSKKSSQDQNSTQGASADSENGLVIDAPELPTAYPQVPYHFRFSAHGNYVPVLRWRLEKGALPPGITLAEDGTLSGVPQRPGEFQFVVAVKDGSRSQQAVQRPFVINVVDALTVGWKVPAHLNGSRIEGSVEVTNATREDMELTFDTKAVAENGRATEIGYQHFPLKGGTIGVALPFGETLPNGNYVVYVTVVGEVAARHAIYRQLLQTPGALHVIVGP